VGKLTAAKVKSITRRGLHGDGGTLYLAVAPRGSKSWVQRVTIDGKRRDIGLGGYPYVGLAAARQKAMENRTAIAAGRDPISEKRRSSIPSFAVAARRTHAMLKPRWRNDKHADSWMQTLERHALPALGGLSVDRIERADVLAVLTPIWGTRPETARRVRQRIRAVLSWSWAHGYVADNVAGEAIDGALPAMPAVKAHLRALPYRDVAAALDTVEASRASLSARACLRFVVMTACRSGEARLAKGDEIHREAREWRIPASRMKAGIEHRVPLSDAALTVLEQVRSLREESGLIFPSPSRPRRPMSDMTLTKVLRDTGLADRATVHGFRSSFRTWASEQTDAPHAVMELSLAHTVGTAVEQAYARSDLLARRRKLMQQWADFLSAD